MIAFTEGPGKVERVVRRMWSEQAKTTAMP